MLGGITAGLLWVVSLPDWTVRSADQVEVEGNQFLSADTIRSLLPIRYPQFLLTLKLQALSKRLEAEAPIAEATVTRHLFPPGLTVHIQERYPVAVAYATSSGSTPAAGGSLAAVNAPTALIDEKGTLIPYDRYVELNPSRNLPSLKVIGMQEQYRPQWDSLYQQISRSPVKVLEIDWSEPGDLVLRTEMGIVHFGAYGPRFARQLLALDQMRQLPQRVPADQIAYIDLRNPDTPLLRMVQSGKLEAPADAENPDTAAAAQPESDRPEQPDPAAVGATPHP